MKRRGASTSALIGALIVGLLIGAGALYVAAPSLGLAGKTVTSTSTSVSTSVSTTTVSSGAAAVVPNLPQFATFANWATFGPAFFAHYPLCKSGQTVPIGELTELTGTGVTSEGIATNQTVGLAIKDINNALAQSGCSLRFRVIVEDYQFSASVAATEVQTLNSEGVKVVVGPLDSSPIAAILNYVDTNHMVIISPSSTSIALAIPNDYVFRTVPDDYFQAMADSGIIASKGYQSIVIVHIDHSYANPLANATGADFVANYGGHVAGNFVYPLTATDFTSILPSIQSAYTTAVGTYGASKVAVDCVCFEEIDQLVKQANTAGDSFVNATWFGTDGEAADNIIANATLGGTLVARTHLYSTLYSPGNSSFALAAGEQALVNRFQALYGPMPNPFYTEGSYDDAWLAAMSVIVGGANDGPTIQSTISSVAANMVGVTGQLTLDQNGDRIMGLADTYQVWGLSQTAQPTWSVVAYWTYGTNKVTWLA